jgi:hypothetical protein
MPAALLAADIQALVRSISSVESTPLALAKQINKHLSRSSPSDRFATTVFIVLGRDSGELTYVNAGHNARSCFLPDQRHFWKPLARPLDCLLTRSTKLVQLLLVEAVPSSYSQMA